MTTQQRDPHGPWQRGWLWVVGYLALFVSVVLAVRFAYASADTLVDALIRAGAAGTAAVVGCRGRPGYAGHCDYASGGRRCLPHLGFRSVSQ
jgi:hypothetical protein